MATLSFKFRQQVFEELIENTINVTGDSIGALDALPIAQFIRNSWEAYMSFILHPQYEMNEVLYRVEPAAPGSPFIPLPVTGLPWAGGGDSEYTPPFATLTLALQCIDGPPYRGYYALGGFAGSQVSSNGRWSDATRNASDALFEAIDLELETNYNGASLCVISRNSSQVPAGTVGVVTNIISRNIIGIRSSRKTARGS